ncbi:flagellar biosynthetic protein FliO [Clostridium botulinum]|uniref:Flagellar protein n=1 Tax=Clostridium botulinum D str. 1873 TaxID=592027 RepID=A0A9P2G847_CLOBO|nr:MULTISPECIES: flagellar biosynthetic protein FliO [Clostridium]NFV46844.1 flagellar biosynthetic protein FliO [Clostridium botulinum]AYF54999.1 flagellar biosynthetic protein FliO [Clostridium novyi]EES91775.1 flagellar biosynthesis protein FliZ [Clostridium botulinum D str. 1873]MBO3442728.1 flagellar biosynthetic protein FliO [Clostridium haemolyticum]MCD3215966.1 flagellar biosynthetic protein FliO [Clostridium botulinum C]
MGIKETIEMFIKVVIFLPFIIFIIYLFFKYGGAKLQEIQNGKYMKILDRMPLSKDNSLLVVKIGEKGYVISSTQGKIDILIELKEEELLKVEESNKIQEYKSIKEAIKKLKFKKEDLQ